MASAEDGPCFLKLFVGMEIGIPACRFPDIVQVLKSFFAGETAESQKLRERRILI
jgi:hypothetical protein